MKAKQFSPQDVHELDSGDFRFFFTAAMVSTCYPLFDDCEDNYGVAKKLHKAGVIGPLDQEDSESGQLFVNFATRQQGERFVRRLNKYLQAKQDALQKAIDL